MDRLTLPRSAPLGSHGRVIATTHRVLSPPSSYTKPRTSMPFFQRIALDALVVPLPASAFYEPPSSASYAKSDAAPNQYPVIEEGSPVWGALYLANRLRSHPDCGYAHYPDLMPSVMKGFESMHPVEVARRKALEQGGQNEARL